MESRRHLFGSLELKSLDKVQIEFKGNREHLTMLLNVLEKEDTELWNNWIRDSFAIIIPDLRGVNLSHQDLKHIYFENANLEDANLEGAFLYEASLRECIFHNTNLKGTYLEKADLYKSEFYNTDLSDSNLQLAILTSATFNNVNLTGAKIFGWNISKINCSNIQCEHIFVDRNQIERLPQNRNFEDGEFENYIVKQKSLEQVIKRDLQKGREMNHVFVSYIREDFEMVLNLTKSLENNGIKVWLDRERLQPGVRWEKAIADAIKNGIYFIACFSKNQSLKEKSYQRKEIRLALKEMELMPDHKIWFIPVKLTKCDLPHFESETNLSIDALQWIDLSENWNDGIQQIIDVIKS